MRDWRRADTPPPPHRAILAWSWRGGFAVALVDVAGRWLALVGGYPAHLIAPPPSHWAPLPEIPLDELQDHQGGE